MDKLIEVVKEKAGFTSNNQLAIAMKTSPELVSSWNLGKSKPNGENTLKLIKLGGLTIDDALSLMTERPATSSGSLVHNAKQCILC